MLEVLKYLGFIVTATSSIWGLIAKTSFEDEDGNKRLTAAGQVSIALAVAGFLVGAGAYGVEQSVSASKAAQQKSAEDLKEARSLAFQERQDRSATETRAWNRRFEALQKATADAQRLADQLLLSGQNAARRDILLTRQMAELRAAGLDRRIQEGTRSNLQRTEVALGQLERLVQPLNSIGVSIEWEIPIRGSEAERSVAPIVELARLAEPWLEISSRASRSPLPPGCEAHRSVTEADRGFDTYSGIKIEPACSVYPTEERNSRLRDSLPEGTLVLFDLDHEDDATIRAELDWSFLYRMIGLSNTVGDAILMGNREETLSYFTESRTLFVRGTAELQAPEWRGRILSIPDIERSQLIVVPIPLSNMPQGYPALRNALRPRRVTIVAERRVYVVPGSAFRQVGPAFVVDTIGRPVPHGLGEPSR